PPTHPPGVKELLLPPPPLPDALVLLPPVVARPIDQADDVDPVVVPDWGAVLVVQVPRIHQLAVDVELEVGVGRVANVHGSRAHIALEMGQCLLAYRGTAVDGVHDLEGAVRLHLLAPRHHPANDGRGAARVAEPHESVEGERGVADPRITVVPVAHAADTFGQPERGC